MIMDIEKLLAYFALMPSETDEYIYFCFKNQAYINTYLVMFNPIYDEHTWGCGERPLIEPLIVQKHLEGQRNIEREQQLNLKNVVGDSLSITQFMVARTTISNPVH